MFWDILLIWTFGLKFFLPLYFVIFDLPFHTLVKRLGILTINLIMTSISNERTYHTCRDNGWANLEAEQSFIYFKYLTNIIFSLFGDWIYSYHLIQFCHELDQSTVDKTRKQAYLSKKSVVVSIFLHHQKKSCIRETLNILTNADHRTNNFLFFFGWVEIFFYPPDGGKKKFK